MRTYARVDTSEGVERKFALLTAQRVVGRSSEVAFTTYHGLKWDPHFQHVFLECGRRLAGWGIGIRGRSGSGGDGARTRRSALAPTALAHDLAARV